MCVKRIIYSFSSFDDRRWDKTRADDGGDESWRWRCNRLKHWAKRRNISWLQPTQKPQHIYIDDNQPVNLTAVGFVPSSIVMSLNVDKVEHIQYTVLKDIKKKGDWVNWKRIGQFKGINAWRVEGGSVTQDPSYLHHCVLNVAKGTWNIFPTLFTTGGITISKTLEVVWLGNYFLECPRSPLVKPITSSYEYFLQSYYRQDQWSKNHWRRKQFCNISKKQSYILRKCEE